MGIAIPASSKSRREQSTPDINVTPLVDVVLVLLIIFMVIAPALEHGERVELPGVLVPDKTQKSKLDPVTVTVAQSGTIYVEKEPVEASALPARLAAIHDVEPDRRVVLKGDGAVDYQKVRDLFTVVQGAGFSGVSLMVSKKKVAGAEEPDEQ
ncbi:MAG: biopolymer transporter ExbD [Labilithrix sp.]|nr:biopolymer transporter ExbD [Labilithrix sp.]MCW5833111.1 biopolymer transporter ExbD [Labilithrix sp.]